MIKYYGGAFNMDLPISTSLGYLLHINKAIIFKVTCLMKYIGTYLKKVQEYVFLTYNLKLLKGSKSTKDPIKFILLLKKSSKIYLTN